MVHSKIRRYGYEKCLQSNCGQPSQKYLIQIAELFDTDKSGISRHIKNIFKESGLSEKATVANFATVQKEGNRKIKRNIEYSIIILMSLYKSYSPDTLKRLFPALM